MFDFLKTTPNFKKRRVSIQPWRAIASTTQAFWVAWYTEPRSDYRLRKYGRNTSTFGFAKNFYEEKFEIPEKSLR